MDIKILTWEDAPEFLHVPEMAQLLRISDVKAYAMCRTEGFPCFKIGRSIRIPKTNLKKWAEEQCSKPDTPNVL